MGSKAASRPDRCRRGCDVLTDVQFKLTCRASTMYVLNGYFVDKVLSQLMSEHMAIACMSQPIETSTKISEKS